MPTLRDFIAAADTAAAAADSARKAAQDALVAASDAESLKAAETAEVNALAKVGGVAFDPGTSMQYLIVDGKVVSTPAVTLDVEIRSDTGGPVVDPDA